MTERQTTTSQWLLLAAALFAAVLAAYSPALSGGFIWDDDGHVTRPDLRTPHGLYRIWYEPGATQQYYPVLHTVFWLEHRLWGDFAPDYHLVNILLHATAALMVCMVLRRLAIPGALLAAAIFALHPVHVESVAWVSEQKNTLSAFFYLAAMLVYLRFDESRRPLLYWCALGLFVLGLESKTVTATLPAALLLIFWWRRGTVCWRRDVLPLTPFFALGFAAGIITAVFERKLIGAEGASFDLSLLDRCLIAGRAVCFYLGKLVLPTNLTFIYPRWRLDPYDWRQYLYIVASLALLVSAWAYRRRSRAPLASLLFFVGTLFPVLGFCNVFPFIYSFVADHFQYLASLGVITAFSATAVTLWQRFARAKSATGIVLCLALLTILGTLTWRQTHMYADEITLYQTTIARNPTCWMAENNLGAYLAEKQGNFAEAIPHYRRALAIKPGYVEAVNNLGVAAAALGRSDEAIQHYRAAIKIRPDYADAHKNLGNALLRAGQLDQAIEQFKLAIDARPHYSEAYNNLGAALAQKGLLAEAVACYQRALEIRPDYAGACSNLADAYAKIGMPREALATARQALEFATQQKNHALADAIRAKIALFESARTKP